MPLYEYRCACGASKDEFNHIAERESGAPMCEACACGDVVRQMAPIISPVRGIMQEDCHYICPETSAPVTSWAQRRNIFAEHGLMDARDIDMQARIRAIKKRRADDEAAVAAFDSPGVDLTPYVPEPAFSR